MILWLLVCPSFLPTNLSSSLPPFLPFSSLPPLPFLSLSLLTPPSLIIISNKKSYSPNIVTPILTHSMRRQPASSFPGLTSRDTQGLEGQCVYIALLSPSFLPFFSFPFPFFLLSFLHLNRKVFTTALYLAFSLTAHLETHSLSFSALLSLFKT